MGPSRAIRGSKFGLESKHFLKNSVVKMSDENARKRAKKNQSDGAYLKGCKHGSTCESDHGESDDGQQQQQSKRELPLTTKFWRQASSLGGKHRYPEWMKFAEVVLVMVPGSVEDERMFSAMKYLKNPQRNRLKEQHLTTCARGFKCKESIQSFPFPSAIGKWLDACPKRGRYGVDDDV